MMGASSLALGQVVMFACAVASTRYWELAQAGDTDYLRDSGQVRPQPNDVGAQAAVAAFV